MGPISAIIIICNQRQLEKCVMHGKVHAKRRRGNIAKWMGGNMEEITRGLRMALCGENCVRGADYARRVLAKLNKIVSASPGLLYIVRPLHIVYHQNNREPPTCYASSWPNTCMIPRHGNGRFLTSCMNMYYTCISFFLPDIYLKALRSACVDLIYVLWLLQKTDS